MAVVIPFTADLSEVRAQLDRLVADARRGIPLSFTGGPTSGGFGGAVTGGTPTVAGTLGVTTSSALAGSFASPLAQGGFFGAGPNVSTTVGLASPTIAGTLGTSGAGNAIPVVATRVSGGGGGDIIPFTSSYAGGGGGSFGGSGGPSFSAGFAGRGFGRLVGLGYSLNMASRAFESGRQYDIDQTLAGNDQQAQLTAMLDYRKRLIGETGFVGRAVGMVQDPTGSVEAALSADLTESRARDSQTQAMRRSANFSDALRARADVASETDPIEKRRRAQEEAHKAELKNIQEERNAREAATDKTIEQTRKALEATRADRAMANVGFFVSNETQRAEVERLRALDEAGLAGDRSESMSKSAARFNTDVANANRINTAELREADRDEMFRRGNAIAGNIFGMEESFSRMTGDPAGVRRARLSARNYSAFSRVGQQRRGIGEYLSVFGERAAETFGDIFEEQVDRQELEQRIQRGRDYSVEDARASAGMAREMLAHRPLSARLAQLEAERTRAGRGRTAAEIDAIDDSFSAREDLARQEDTEARGLRGLALAGQNRSLNLILRDSPRGARANDIATDAFLEAQKLRNIGDDTSANQVIKNAVLQEQVLRKSYLESFKPVEVDPTYTAINGPRGGQEDSTQVLKDIKTAIDTLNSNLTGGVVVGP